MQGSNRREFSLGIVAVAVGAPLLAKMDSGVGPDPDTTFIRNAHRALESKITRACSTEWPRHFTPKAERIHRQLVAIEKNLPDERKQEMLLYAAEIIGVRINEGTDDASFKQEIPGSSGFDGVKHPTLRGSILAGKKVYLRLTVMQDPGSEGTELFQLSVLMGKIHAG